MQERYSLPRPERVTRHFPESWRDFLFQYWPGGSKLSLDGSFTVTEDNKLGYRRFVRGEEANVEFELLFANEASDLLIRSGKARTKKEIKSEITRVRRNPAGSTSIDPDKDRLREYRSINAASEELEERLGIPLAIKGFPSTSTSTFREDLLAQFIFMRNLERQWQHLPDDVKKVIRICKVYGAMRYRMPGTRKYEEWLFMERVVNPQRVEDERMGTYPSGGRAYGFEIGEHPNLAAIVETYVNDFSGKSGMSYNNKICFEWPLLLKALRKAGLKLSDLAGYNLLYDQNLQRRDRNYVIIDQRDRSKEKLINFR